MSINVIETENFSIQNSTVKIYSENLRYGNVNKTFVETGILVSRINLCEDKLENYFSKLIGGGGIA